MLYAVVGIAALFDAPTAPAPVVWEQSFTVQANQSDRAVADRVVRLLGLSLATAAFHSCDWRMQVWVMPHTFPSTAQSALIVGRTPGPQPTPPFGSPQCG